MSASTSPPVTKAVVLVETTAKDVSTTEPYRVLSRSKACGTAFRVRRDLFPKAEWNRETVQLYLSNYHVIEGAEDKRVRMRVASSPEYTSGRVVHCVPALDFALIGILSRIATLLARVSISIFAISTYDTDYVLIKSEHKAQATATLQAAGYVFTS